MPLWQSTYDGPVHGEDKVTGLVTDAACRCFLTGYSYGDTTDYDFATICVDSTGTTRWTSRYGSPLHCEDRSWCLARDSAGNIIASGGTIADFAVGWDFQTIKYHPSGDTAWLRRQDFTLQCDDKPVALGVGPGNVIWIAGASRRKPGPGNSRSDWDISIVKYSPAGEILLTRLYDGTGRLDDYASSLAIDDSGNCYIEGKTTSVSAGTDIVLLKYRSDGTLAWHRDIDGPARASDMAAVVLLDRVGRVFVIGSVTGRASSFDYFVAAFDTAGRLLWQQQYDGAGRVDVAIAACLDAAGNIIVTGQSTGNGTSFDIATLKYSTAGRLLWARRYDGLRGAADRGWCVTTDRQSRVYVGGNSIGATAYPDILIISYTADGDSLWSFRRSGTGSGEARPVALQAWDAEGENPGPGIPKLPRLLVAGWASMASTGFDYLLLLLDPADRRRNGTRR